MKFDKKDNEKTAFTIQHEIYQFIRALFRLQSVPATFQRVIDLILSSIRWQSTLLYLDDIVIFSKSVEEHVQLVRKVVTMLRDVGITLKLKKCPLFAERKTTSDMSSTLDVFVNEGL